MNTDKYIGKEFENCAEFVQHVVKVETGKDVIMPNVTTWKRLSQEQVIEWGENYAYPVEVPQELDAVLMRIRGSHRVSLGSHIGLCVTYRKPNPDWPSTYCHVLHQLERMGGVLTPFRNLHTINLEICGFYRWR